MQGLKSDNAMTVRGSILLQSETSNEIFSAASTGEAKDCMGLTLKKVRHNSQYSVTRQPTEIVFDVVLYVYNVSRWHRTTRSRA